MASMESTRNLEQFVDDQQRPLTDPVKLPKMLSADPYRNYKQQSNKIYKQII